jgi:hypothetical protein
VKGGGWEVQVMGVLHCQPHHFYVTLLELSRIFYEDQDFFIFIPGAAARIRETAKRESA